ncbi:hypothetical protein [Litchfieldia alkalitelluris]|uniref:hypothetical protein n=1 Tax=Litchfieldia alkalitelluris TaxID=304268 RepID=UPI001473F91A|nr:hypothetical protein [Litchfieldia alkalitelluris]
MEKEKKKCICLEIFRKKYGEHVKGECFKMNCARYRKEYGFDETELADNDSSILDQDS